MTAKHADPLEIILLDNGFEGEIFSHEPMGKHTSYRIGGPARYYIRVDTLSALKRLIDICNAESIERYIVGRGTNLLVSDEGYDGVIINLGSGFRNHRIDAEQGIIVSGAAVPLSKVVQDAFKESLGGLEFAVGTPGSIGGAIKMNAGSKDEWIGSVVKDVTAYSDRYGLKKFLESDLEWSYRTSSFKDDEVILECTIEAKPADPFFIRGKMEANLAKRKKTQPIDLPSCGSVFKNPPGMSAAKMIDDLGLKGTRIGGAEISQKHANFIVNVDHASAQDVCDLIALIMDKVLTSYNVQLIPEVRFLGFE